MKDISKSNERFATVMAWIVVVTVFAVVVAIAIKLLSVLF